MHARRPPRLRAAPGPASTTTAPARPRCWRSPRRWPSSAKNKNKGSLTNRVAFAFWGAEESGLVGSTYFVENLTAAERADIMANLNFDMLASPNFARLVYDGDGNAVRPRGPGGLGRDRARVQPVLRRPRASRTRRPRSAAARTTARSSRPASRRAACSPARRRRRRSCSSSATAAWRACGSTRATTRPATRWRRCSATPPTSAQGFIGRPDPAARRPRPSRATA